MYPPSLDFMVGFLACLKVGVVAVPVFPPNPARRDSMQMFSNISASSGAHFALTSSEYNHMKKLAGLKDALRRVNRPLQGSWPDSLTWIVTDDDKTNKMNSLWPTPHPSDLAFLQYTSGSTSEPKGVMITQGNLSHNLKIITAELKASDDTVVVSWLPQYHDMGLIGSYLGVIYCGGSGIYLSPLAFLQRPMLWMEAISKYRATHLQAPNFAFKLTAQKFDPSNYVNKPLNFRCVRHIVNAAEPVDEASMQTFYTAFGPFGLANVIYPTYGLAEHTVFVCSGGKQVITVRKATLEVDGKVQAVEDANEDETVSRLVGCGFPMNQNVDVRIVDPDTCQELPYDRVGEVWISSPSKAAGYLARESDTITTFQARLKSKAAQMDANQYLRTGDIGFMHNEELFICGRLKDLIIVRGRNHFPQDIEATAETVSTNFRPGCSAAFTIDPTGGDEKVALVMELRNTPPAHQAEKQWSRLADEVRATINHEHSLGISQLVFLKPKTVPKTTSGKIARSWCRKGFLAGTLQVVYRKSFNDKVSEADLGHTDFQSSLENETTNDLQVSRNDDLIDKLRADVSRIGQLPPDSVDRTTALVTILDSLSLSQLKGLLEDSYAMSVSDDFLYDEGTTLLKIAEVVERGTAVDNEDHIGHSSAAIEGYPSARGLAGALGCPPGVVCCVVQ